MSRGEMNEIASLECDVAFCNHRWMGFWGSKSSQLPYFSSKAGIFNKGSFASHYGNFKSH